MKVKICGMKEPGNIADIAALQPDYMGFIFYPPSPRYVGDLPEDFDLSLSDIVTTAVFVNEKLETVIRLVKKYGFGAVQLHGNESIAFCEQLKNMCDVRVIKSFGIKSEYDFDAIKMYESACDFFLFDAKVPGFGGSGNTFNWNVFDNYHFDKPFFLSGGLSPDNLSEALLLKEKGLPLYALDLNSKFESNPGVKDVEKVKVAIKLINNIV